MTTALSGGRISGRIAGTFSCATARTFNDPLMVVGNYAVDLADGSKPVVGYVGVPNVKRVAGAYPVANPGGDVTVELSGFSIATVTSGGAIAAGLRVKVGAGGVYLQAANGDEGVVGIALTATSGAAQSLDVMFI
jgi:hypothetical protein